MMINWELIFFVLRSMLLQTRETVYCGKPAGIQAWYWQWSLFQCNLSIIWNRAHFYLPAIAISASYLIEPPAHTKLAILQKSYI